MNAGLKVIIETALDLVGASVSVVKKEDFAAVIMPKLFDAFKDVPALVAEVPGILEEIEALKAPEAQADLIAYVIAEVAGVTSSEQAKAVISAVLVAVGHVVSDVIAIRAAIIAAPMEAA